MKRYMCLLRIIRQQGTHGSEGNLVSLTQRTLDSTAVGVHYDWLAEPVGLYLHVPFCESKCIYCDFNSYAHMEDKFEPFVDAICADIRRGISRDLAGTHE